MKWWQKRFVSPPRQCDMDTGQLSHKFHWFLRRFVQKQKSIVMMKSEIVAAAAAVAVASTHFFQLFSHRTIISNEKTKSNDYLRYRVYIRTKFNKISINIFYVRRPIHFITNERQKAKRKWKRRIQPADGWIYLYMMTSDYVCVDLDKVTRQFEIEENSRRQYWQFMRCNANDWFHSIPFSFTIPSNFCELPQFDLKVVSSIQPSRVASEREGWRTYVKPFLHRQNLFIKCLKAASIMYVYRICTRTVHRSTFRFHLCSCSYTIDRITTTTVSRVHRHTSLIQLTRTTHSIQLFIPLRSTN